MRNERGWEVGACDLPEAKAEERMAAAWASLRLSGSDMVVDKARVGSETLRYTLYKTQAIATRLYITTHPREYLQCRHPSDPS